MPPRRRAKSISIRSSRRLSRRPVRWRAPTIDTWPAKASWRWRVRSRRPSSRAARSSPRPAPASARPSATWCRRCCRGARALVSTATKSLQDQLFLRDLPRLRDALAMPVTLALLKGRASYLCLHRLAAARQSAVLPDRWAVRTLARIEQWATATTTGDLAEIDGLDERSPVIPLVTSTRENCLGTRLPGLSRLPRDEGAPRGDGGRRRGRQPPPVLRRHGAARQRRRRAAADRRCRGVRRGASAGRGGRAVPRHDARRPGRCSIFARDLLALGCTCARPAGLAGTGWRDRVRRARPAPGLRGLRCASDAASLRSARAQQKLRWDERCDSEAFQKALSAAGEACAAVSKALSAVEGAAPDLAKLGERARSMSRIAALFALRRGVGSRALDRSDAAAGAARRIAARHPRRAALSRSAARRGPGSSPRRRLGDDDAVVMVHRKRRPRR